LKLKLHWLKSVVSDGESVPREKEPPFVAAPQNCIRWALKVPLLLQNLLQMLGQLPGKIPIRIQTTDWPARKVSFFVEDYDRRELVNAEFFRNDSVWIS
jgi:hypothetical protein